MERDPYVSGWAFNKVKEESILLTGFILILAGTLVYLRPGVFSIAFLLFCIAVFTIVLYFFRDPDRINQRSGDVFYSAGDGVVSDITSAADPSYPDQKFLRVGIFLSVFDVHVQRAPIRGEVKLISHQPGKNLPAYDPGASAENDQILMAIESEYGIILVKQISGILARKCLNYAQPGDKLEAGQRYGLIKFGSRVELYLPENARLQCKIGDKVNAGISGIAVMSDQEE